MSPLTRRRFLQRAGLALGGVAIAPGILAACGGDDETTTTGSGAGTAGGGGDSLTVANWPLYIDEESVALFREETGIDLTYTEEINDNVTFFARVQPVLNAGDVLDADIITPTFWLTARLLSLGWLDTLPLDEIPNIANLDPSLQNPAWDPTGEYSLPWQSGLAGIAYNIEATGRELRTMEDLLDPEFAGRIGMLTEMRDTVGLWMLHTGKSLENATFDDAAEAFEIIERANADGQIRAFTGNDYQDDLISGNFVANIAWSGDIAQLQLDEPNLRFVVPESGSTLWSDVMSLPKGAVNRSSAAKWMDWCYDPVNAARIASFVGYMSPVVGVRDVLAASDDEFERSLADNELMFPSEETLANTDSWGLLSDEEEAKFDERFAAITGAG
jgi:spermidine/putrescine transport system substrate-binding protein